MSDNDGKFWKGNPDGGIYDGREGIECQEYYHYNEDQKLIRLEGHDRNGDFEEGYFTVYYYDESGRAMGDVTQYSERWAGSYLTYDQSGRAAMEPGSPQVMNDKICPRVSSKCIKRTIECKCECNAYYSGAPKTSNPWSYSNSLVSSIFFF